MTIDSIDVEMRHNRSVMRDISPKTSLYQKLLKKNVELGAMMAAIKRKEDPEEAIRKSKAYGVS
jgi:hypothetical protein